MKKMCLIISLVVLGIFVFTSTSFANTDVNPRSYLIDNLEWKEYQRGNIEIRSNLPSDIQPEIKSIAVDKKGNEHSVKAIVEHKVLDIRKNDDVTTYDIQTTIQSIGGPYYTDDDDEDHYNNGRINQYQITNYSYKKDDNTYEHWYKLDNTEVYWTRTKDYYVIGDPVSIGHHSWGTDINGYGMNEDYLLNPSPPSWKSETESYTLRSDSPDSWEYCDGASYPHVSTFVGGDVYDAYGWVYQLNTAVILN